MAIIDNWKLVVLERYAKFDGRAGQGEFWWYYLANLIIAVVLGVLAAAIHWVFWLIFVVYALSIIIPTVAVSIRRLHDTDKSGWWMLISFVPFGGLVLLVFYVMSGSPHQNRYGDAPAPAA
ncbi:DUF805 domain-containing protein [Ilumatobacter nonamiensis]|uniref:DUF805 domain-containing protein n=1 Tax=Ilumatobacter nonamiensis TaxID=467093 RepID=UPI00034594A9|nr:DUF805 domain-containing protein [Ilumatobacter nonamiensis]